MEAEDSDLNSGHEKQWCFCLVENEPLVGGEERAALVKSLRWNPGDTINVGFLDGDKALQRRVMMAARGWTGANGARLTFERVDDLQDAQIRISFRFPGSWSLLGTSCLRRTDITKPTMNYGWLHPDSTDEELNRVVLHEFGHALGLIHEHMSPARGIPWNKAKVYEALSGEPNNWDKATIDNNMFATFSRKETRFTKVDPTSIMMYPIPPEWTDGRFSVGLNSTLSKTDLEFIRKIYKEQ